MMFLNITYHDSKCDTEHEYISSKIVGVIKEYFWRMVAVGAQNVITYHLLCEYSLSHAKVNDSHWNLFYNSGTVSHKLF